MYGSAGFEAAGMRMSPYFEFLSRLRREVPVLAGENDNELSESQRSLLERYYSIEYLNYTEPDVTKKYWTD